ncbi:hypothetical protein [Kitasatospora sp. NBC_00315]|uniref:hypothetical protein n=1 Tax=Kitasatospora sp. NBC_00315 TaxID=2975963 RepID=UPI0032536D03
MNDATVDDAATTGATVNGARSGRTGAGRRWSPGGAVTVEIEDITPPATFGRAADAVAALWEAMRVLPLGWTQYEAYRYFLGPGAVARIEESIERDGELSLTFRMAGRLHSVRVTPAH